LSNDLVEVSAAPANLEFGGFFPFAPASTSYSLVLEKVVYRTLAHWEYLVAPGKALWFVQKRYWTRHNQRGNNKNHGPNGLFHFTSPFERI
jgi:hypothetical protein